jgi:hypothetical protein
VESFFNFFKNYQAKDKASQASKVEEAEDDEDDEGEEEVILIKKEDAILDELDLSNQLKDEIIPYALEYFLQQKIDYNEEECEDEEDQCAHKHAKKGMK